VRMEPAVSEVRSASADEPKVFFEPHCGPGFVDFSRSDCQHGFRGLVDVGRLGFPCAFFSTGALPPDRGVQHHTHHAAGEYVRGSVVGVRGGILDSSEGLVAPNRVIPAVLLECEERHHARFELG